MIVALLTVDHVEAAIAAGNLEGAAFLAAKLPRPQDHLKAMRCINAARTNPSPLQETRTMYVPKFELTEAKNVLLASINVRAENHGKEKEPAGDLGFVANMPAVDALPMFDPTLHSALYMRNDHQVDAASAGTEGLVNLRFPKLGLPLKWTREIVGAELRIHRGIGPKSDIVIEECTVNDFKISPYEGGTVLVAFRVQHGKLDEKIRGKLDNLVQQVVDISLTPPDDGGETAKPDLVSQAGDGEPE